MRMSPWGGLAVSSSTTCARSKIQGRRPDGVAVSSDTVYVTSFALNISSGIQRSAFFHNDSVFRNQFSDRRGAFEQFGVDLHKRDFERHRKLVGLLQGVLDTGAVFHAHGLQACPQFGICAGEVSGEICAPKQRMAIQTLQDLPENPLLDFR